MSDETFAMKKAMWHARVAKEWTPRFFGLTGDAKISNFHRQASMLYAFRAAKGLAHDDLDWNAGKCMEHQTYNLRVGRYEGTLVIPLEPPMNFSISSSACKDWRDCDFRSAK